LLWWKVFLYESLAFFRFPRRLTTTVYRCFHMRKLMIHRDTGTSCPSLVSLLQTQMQFEPNRFHKARTSLHIVQFKRKNSLSLSYIFFAFPFSCDRHWNFLFGLWAFKTGCEEHRESSHYTYDCQAKRVDNGSPLGFSPPPSIFPYLCGYLTLS